MTDRMRRLLRTRNIALFAVCAAVTVELYVLLHELGHCAVALWCGARITEFSIINPHMTCDGGSFSFGQVMLLHAGGVILTTAVSALYLIFYSPTRGGGAYHTFSFIFTLAAAAGILPWIVTPVMYICGTAPPGEDCTKLLNIFVPYFGMPAEVVAAAAGVAFVFYAALIYHRGVVERYVEFLMSEE